MDAVTAHGLSSSFVLFIGLGLGLLGIAVVHPEISTPAFISMNSSAEYIWPVFGAANQLIAALALFVVTIWIVGMKKPSIYTLYPGIVMLLTTIAALVILSSKYILEGNYLLGGTSIILLILAVLVVVETISCWRSLIEK